jgi:hypothetical protein
VARAAKPKDAYISPCLYLGLPACPPSLSLAVGEGGAIELKGTGKKGIVSLDVEGFSVQVSASLLVSQAEQIATTVEHEHLDLLRARLDSLDLSSKVPLALVGRFRTDVLNWLLLSVLKRGDCQLLHLASGDTVKTIQCAGYRAPSGNRITEGADFWVPHKGPLYRIALSVETISKAKAESREQDLDGTYAKRLKALAIPLGNVDMSQLKGRWKGIRQVSYRPENKVQWDKELFQDLFVSDDSCKFVFFGDMTILHSTTTEGRAVISSRMITRQEGAGDIVQEKRKVLLYVVSLNEEDLVTALINKGQYAHITRYSRVVE